MCDRKEISGSENMLYEMFYIAFNCDFPKNNPIAYVGLNTMN